MTSSIPQSRKVFAIRCVLSLALVAGLAALFPDTGWPQGGKGSLRIDQQIQPWGGTLGVRYTAPAPEKDYYGVEPWPDNFDANTAPDDQSQRGGYRKIIPKGVWRFDTRYLGSFAPDPARAVLDVRMIGQQGLDVGTVGLAKALLWRPIVPEPNALDLGGRNRFAIGEKIAVKVKLRETPRRQPVASDGRTGPQDAKCCLSLDIYRPGRVAPGGATEAERLQSDRFLGTLEDGRAEVMLVPPLHPGPYELRLVAPGSVILDRARFEVVLPKAALRVSSVAKTSESGEIAIRISAPQWKFLRVLKVAPGGALQYLGDAFDYTLLSVSASGGEIRLSSTASVRAVEPPQLPPRPPGMDETTWRKLTEAITKAAKGIRKGPAHAPVLPGSMPPGEYEARLYWNEAGQLDVRASAEGPFYALQERQREYIIASARFTIPAEGVGKEAARPQAAPGAAMLAVKEPRVVIESPIEATAKLPPKLPPSNEPLWLSFFRKGGVTAEGSRYEDAYVRGPMPLGKDGGVIFPAPEMPGQYELRLYRGREPERAALRFPPADLLARAEVEVVVPPLRGALRLAGGGVVKMGEPTELVVEIPSKRFRKGLQVVLVNSAEVLPGGAVRPSDARAFESGLPRLALPEVRACRMSIPIEPFRTFGVFEFRLFDPVLADHYDAASFGLARFPFKVIDPELPAFPAGVAHRLADEPEWLAPSVTVGRAPDETDPECAPPKRVAQGGIAPGGRWPEEGP